MGNKKNFETFDGSLYKRNGLKCKAKVIYWGKEISGEPQFRLIEKNYAPWDGYDDKSYSAGWYKDGTYWVLGLPRELKDVAKLIELFDTDRHNMN